MVCLRIKVLSTIKMCSISIYVLSIMESGTWTRFQIYKVWLWAGRGIDEFDKNAVFELPSRQANFLNFDDYFVKIFILPRKDGENLYRAILRIKKFYISGGKLTNGALKM